MSVPVLIVGAGPTGLMMACQLSRFNIPFRIIEKNSGPSEKSKALALQSRSLEIYDQMDIASTAINEGHETTVINLIVKGKKIQRINLSDVGKGLSPFPFLHIFEQNKNEKLLIEYLNARNIFVEWNTELKEISQNENEVISIVEKNNFREEIHSHWLFGGDGGSSTVRHQLKIAFPGETYENIFYVADTAVEWDLGYDELIGYFSRNTLTAFFPMKGKQRFRLVGILPEKFQDVDNITFDDIKENISEAIEDGISFSDTRWFSVYKLHHRCVENFQSGRCFLGGDSAHIHSPAGGQGMNTGLQDAYNLAWKIALVEKQFADERILDTYNDERLPFAMRLIRTTDRAFGFGVSRNPVISFFRLNIFPWLSKVLMSNNIFKTFAYKGISQISIKYPKSSMTVNELSHSVNIKAGERLPYCFVYEESNKRNISLYDLMKDPLFYILIFDIGKDEGYFEYLKKIFNNTSLFKMIFIKNIPENRKVYELFGIKKKLICIVRPDIYIGYLSDNFDNNRIENYFKKIGVIL